MNAVLKIGRLEILLPSEAAAIAAMKALSKGILVDSRFTEMNGKYQYVYEVEEDFELGMEMKILSPSAKIIDSRKGKKHLRLNDCGHTPTAEEELGI
jgi:hypothetical protein